MKTYTANEDLIQVFYRNGLIETTTRLEKTNGNRSFGSGTSPRVRRRIRFEEIIIKVVVDGFEYYSCQSLTPLQARLLIFLALASSHGTAVVFPRLPKLHDKTIRQWVEGTRYLFNRIKPSREKDRRLAALEIFDGILV